MLGDVVGHHGHRPDRPLLCLLLHSAQVFSTPVMAELAPAHRYIPARLALHIVSGVLAVVGGFVVVKVYRASSRPRRRYHHWDRETNEAHTHDISRESNVL